MSLFNLKYYNSLLELIKCWGLTVDGENLSHKDIRVADYVTINASKENSPIFVFLLIFSDDKELFKSQSLERIFKNIPEIKRGNILSLKIYVLADEAFKKNITLIFNKINSEDQNHLIHCTFIDKTITLVNPLEHEFMSDIKIFRTETEINEECSKINLNKFNNKWHVNVLPKIYMTDPVAVWLCLSPGNLIYTNSSYRLCVDV